MCFYSSSIVFLFIISFLFSASQVDSSGKWQMSIVHNGHGHSRRAHQQHWHPQSTASTMIPLYYTGCILHCTFEIHDVQMLINVPRLSNNQTKKMNRDIMTIYYNCKHKFLLAIVQFLFICIVQTGKGDVYPFMICQLNITIKIPVAFV